MDLLAGTSVGLAQREVEAKLLYRLLRLGRIQHQEQSCNCPC